MKAKTFVVFFLTINHVSIQRNLCVTTTHQTTPRTRSRTRPESIQNRVIAPRIVAMEREARAMALRIIAEEERDGWSRPLTSEADDAFQRRFGALGLDEATESLTEDEALQAKILMRDLPRVLAELEATGEKGSRGEPELVAALHTKEEPVLSPPPNATTDAMRIEDENDVGDDRTCSGVSKNQSRSETTTTRTGEDVGVWRPGKGTALERVCALEAELRMILGEDIVSSALDGELRSSIDDGSSAGGSGTPDEMLREVERFGANEASAVAETVETPTPRKKLVLMPTPIGKGDESPDPPDFEPVSAPVAKDTSAERPQRDQAWDPYSAFIGVAKERHYSPRTEPLTSNPISPPKASGGMTVDFSLTHDETMRLVADLEQKVKSSPKVKSPRPSLSEYKNDVMIEDVAEDEENDEQKYTHQYTKADAKSILELTEPERGDEYTGLWRTRDEEDVTPRPPSTVKPSPRDAGDGVKDATENAVYESKIAGVESLAEFKMMMDSVFEDA